MSAYDYLVVMCYFQEGCTLSTCWFALSFRPVSISITSQNIFHYIELLFSFQSNRRAILKQFIVYWIIFLLCLSFSY